MGNYYQPALIVQFSGSHFLSNFDRTLRIKTALRGVTGLGGVECHFDWCLLLRIRSVLRMYHEMKWSVVSLLVVPSVIVVIAHPFLRRCSSLALTWSRRVLLFSWSCFWLDVMTNSTCVNTIYIYFSMGSRGARTSVICFRLPFV